MQRGQVRNTLLQTARRLCARHGVGATSLRQVIDACGANLNSIHYHFGSRDGLISAVVDEAHGTLNAERAARFDAIEGAVRANRSLGATPILAAAYEPLFRQALGPDRAVHREGLLVLGQLRFQPQREGAAAMERHAGEFVTRVEGLLRLVLPHTPKQLREGMQFVNASAWDSALRPDVLSRVETQPRLWKQLTQRFLTFAEAGLLGIAGTRRS